MPILRVITVCLSKDTPACQLSTLATHAVLAKVNGASRPSPVGHFMTSVRVFGQRLVNKFADTTAGGPIRLLDLQKMEEHSRATYWNRWHVFHQVVAATKPAQPFWHFADRHRADAKYTIAQAQQHYLAQPRIQAMNTYNMLPNRVMDLPTGHLEALQNNADAYKHLGGFTAVPAHGFITLAGTYLAPATQRLSDLQAYLSHAHHALRRMSKKDQLIAIGYTA